MTKDADEAAVRDVLRAEFGDVFVRARDADIAKALATFEVCVP